MWDRKAMECLREFTVAYSFRNVKDNFSWTFVGVYGLNFDCDRRYLWDELTGLLCWWNLPLCVAGDFNITFAFPVKDWVQGDFVHGGVLKFYF